ncbi:hypothetical protein OROMI_000813 [Orobanche minor]
MIVSTSLYFHLYHIGVYEVKIEAGEHKVTVSGKVDCAELIDKLAKTGKHAEIWTPPTSNWSENGAYLNKQRTLMHGLDNPDYQPLSLQYPRDEDIPIWEEFERCLKNNQQMGENFWARNENNMSDMGSIDYGTSYSSYYGTEQFDRFNNIYTGWPLYEYQYQLPVVMNNMQGPWYNYYPYSMMYNNMHPISNNIMEKNMYAFN